MQHFSNPDCVQKTRPGTETFLLSFPAQTRSLHRLQHEETNTTLLYSILSCVVTLSYKQQEVIHKATIHPRPRQSHPRASKHQSITSHQPISLTSHPTPNPTKPQSPHQDEILSRPPTRHSWPGIRSSSARIKGRSRRPTDHHRLSYILRRGQ